MCVWGGGGGGGGGGGKGEGVLQRQSMNTSAHHSAKSFMDPLARTLILQCVAHVSKLSPLILFVA